METNNSRIRSTIKMESLEFFSNTNFFNLEEITEMEVPVLIVHGEPHCVTASDLMCKRTLSSTSTTNENFSKKAKQESVVRSENPTTLELLAKSRVIVDYEDDSSTSSENVSVTTDESPVQIESLDLPSTSKQDPKAPKKRGKKKRKQEKKKKVDKETETVQTADKTTSVSGLCGGDVMPLENQGVVEENDLTKAEAARKSPTQDQKGHDTAEKSTSITGLSSNETVKDKITEEFEEIPSQSSGTKKKPTMPKSQGTEKDKQPDSENKDSSDEEVNKLNQANENLQDYRSIKDLPEKRYFKCKKFEIVTTANGKTIRVQLEDSESDVFYVHLPRRFLKVIEENLKEYLTICNSDKPFFMAFLGLKGKGFQIHFTRNPQKHQ